MKKILSVLVVLFCFLNVSAQDDQAMMEAWQKYMTPGPMHAMLAKTVWEWKTETTMWMDPSQPPSTSEGTAVCEALLDGRYFKTIHEGNIMGMPFTGIDVSGYDNTKNKFFSTWIDNMGTGVMLLEGTFDEAAKTTTLTGTALDPMGKEVTVRETFKWIDDNTILFEMFSAQDGKEFKSMEMKYIRKKI